jgi:thiamine biosynthesis protein ThiS
MAKILANGVPTEVGAPYRLLDFLRRGGWKPTQVVVELNGQVVLRSQVNSVVLNDGDRVEIIVPVAGG